MRVSFDYGMPLLAQRTLSYGSSMSTSQTLSRGLTALEFVALADTPPRIDAVADHLDVHRSIAYRIVRTLELHHLVNRADDGGLRPGLRLAALGRSAQSNLRSVAVVELARVADELEMTTFLVVRDGDEVLTIESLEPSNSRFHVAYKPGIRHAVDLGAPGLAVLAGAPPDPDERREVTQARAIGWTSTSGEVIPGMASVAVPVPGASAAIATVFLGGASVELDPIAQRLRVAATSIAAQLADPETPAKAAS